MKTRSQYKQPQTDEFEFFGPHGTLLTILCLPLTVLGLYFLCDDQSCSIPVNLDDLKNKIQIQSLWNQDAFYGYIIWILFQFLLSIIVPGKTVYGHPLPIPSSQRLPYKINGFGCFVFNFIILSYATYAYGWSQWLWIATHYVELAFSGIIFTSLLSLILYIYSYRSDQVVVAKGGNSGFPIYDFWMGRELNPRVFSLDLKFICELRPGLIGWFLLNTALAVQQYHHLGRLTNSMILVILAQGYYVFDALWNEVAILTTMDITTDGFGFMLVFGDLVWVPFTYSLQARYLSIYPEDLSFEFLFFCISLNLIGLYIFRNANSEKNAFRSNPSSEYVSHLKYFETESGSKLLISGWWGMARKINYTGWLNDSLLTQ
jgi:delta14-sterol reductase